MFTHLDDDGSLGVGTSGNVVDNNDGTITKIQYIKVDDPDALKKVQHEADVLLDVGVAKGELVTQQTSHRQVRLSQILHHLGNSLSATIATEQLAQGRTTTSEEEINRAISLCLHVAELHNGSLSESGKKFARFWQLYTTFS